MSSNVTVMNSPYCNIISVDLKTSFKRVMNSCIVFCFSVSIFSSCTYLTVLVDDEGCVMFRDYDLVVSPKKDPSSFNFLKKS